MNLDPISRNGDCAFCFVYQAEGGRRAVHQREVYLKEVRKGYTKFGNVEAIKTYFRGRKK